MQNLCTDHNKCIFFLLRSLLGPDLLIIHLSMKKEDIMERVSKRHSGNKDIIEMMEVEPLHKNQIISACLHSSENIKGS